MPGNVRENAERDNDVFMLLAEGLSFSEIAARFGCTKNAVAGAVDRARRRGEIDDSGAAPKSCTKNRLDRYHVGINGCRWVVGEPGTSDWRWCGGTLVLEKPPYCAEHLSKILARVSHEPEASPV